MNRKTKLIRITTVPMALAYPLRGQPSYMQFHGFDVIMISAGGKELPMLLSNEQCRHITVEMTRRITPFRDLAGIWNLYRIFKKEKPVIVHAETPKAGLLGMIAGMLAGVKVRIYTQAGITFVKEKGLKLFLLKLIERITYAFATNVWPNSPSTKKYIIDQRLAKEKKLTVVGGGSSNGIDTARFSKVALDPGIIAEVKKELHSEDNSIYLLFMGRLVADKGITELVEAFREICANEKNLWLVLAGDYEDELDPLPSAIKKEIAENPHILRVGWTDIPEYFIAAADYFVFPSHREGFPNVLLEAGAMKLPIICSRILGNVDIIRHGETGLLFEPSDKNDLQQKIYLALHDPGRMKEMAEKLSEIITTKYKREIFWKAQEDEYRRLTKQ